MNEEEHLSQTPLDSMVCRDTTQLLKAAVPYLSPKGQQLFSIYAKYLELSQTISLFRRSAPELSMMSTKIESKHPEDMLQDIRRFTSGPIRDQIDQLLFALNTVQLLSMYQENPENQEVSHV